MVKIIRYFLLTLLLALTIYFSQRYFAQYFFVSPLGEESRFRYLQELIIPRRKQKDKLVYGFLPYWNLDKVSIQEELTHLAYFGLEIDSDGSILTENRPGETEPGYYKLNSDEFLDLLGQKNLKVDLVLKQFENNQIEEFINSKTAQEELLKNLDSILLAYPINGLNIDIEYSGEASDELRANFVLFLRRLNQYLDQKYQNIDLSLDVYASAGDVSKKLIWDVAALESEIDYLIVMAYDFHQRSSNQAGPVAPLFGGDELWEHDINVYFKGFLDQIPREKILLGIPFYGYGWQTDSLDSQANTYPGSGFTISYEEVLKLLSGESIEDGNWEDCYNVAQHWQEDALSPYISLNCQEKGNTVNYIIYFENPRSLSYKLEYASQLDLAGIAIWALGYENSGRQLWDVIKANN